MPNKWYEKAKQLVTRINSTSQADFVKRLQDPNREVIIDKDGNIATHRMSWSSSDNKAIVYPEIQNINGKLVQLNGKDAIDSAIERKDTIMMSKPEARWFTTHYKAFYPGFDKY